MSTEPYIAIVNGAAGGGRCRARFDAALKRIEGRGVEVKTYLTHAEGHATELAREHYARGARRFLSVGGDGTSYEIVNGLFPEAHAGETPTLAMLPLGTGNSFLRDFGIEHEDAALEALARGATRGVDVVRVTHAGGLLHYINLLTVGFVTRAGDLTNRRFKVLGDRGYLVAAMIEIARLKLASDPILVDEQPYGDARPAAFLTFSNSQYTGGAFHIAPHADPTDGFVDIVRANAMPRLAFTKNLLGAYEGKHVEDPRVEESRARKVEFLEPREQLVMLDGEILPLTLESLEVLPGALQVVA